jgi:hypothetical protein
MIQTNEQLRLARMEAMCAQLRAEMDDVQMTAYEAAVQAQDEDRAAELARLIRNKMLTASDKYASVDRPTDDAWITYRQALRDLPDQEGFPFDVTFPTAPTTESTGDTVLERVVTTESDSITALEGIAEIYEMMLGGE